MLTTRYPISPLRPKNTGRVPLQAKNTLFSHPNSNPNPEKSIPIYPINYANKENHPDYTKPEIEVSSMDASLADELNSVRKRLDRLRMDKLTTERMLMLRDRVFEMRFEELMLRGEFQKQLENDVDRLYRLKQLQLPSTSMSPICSLRDREMRKRSVDSPSMSQLQKSLRKTDSVDRSVRMTASFRSESISSR